MSTVFFCFFLYFVLVFPEEKNFIQGQKVTRRHDKWLCTSHNETFTAVHSKFLLSLIVFESHVNHTMLPHIFLQGLRANATAYTKTLDTAVNPWITRERPYKYQQFFDVSQWSGYRTIFTIMLPRIFGLLARMFKDPMNYYICGIVDRAQQSCPQYQWLDESCYLGPHAKHE